MASRFGQTTLRLVLLRQGSCCRTHPSSLSLSFVIHVRKMIGWFRCLIGDRPTSIGSPIHQESNGTSRSFIGVLDQWQRQYRFRYLSQFWYRRDFATILAQLLVNPCSPIHVNHRSCISIGNLVILKSIHDLFALILVDMGVIARSRSALYWIDSSYSFYAFNWYPSGLKVCLALASTSGSQSFDNVDWLIFFRSERYTDFCWNRSLYYRNYTI
jgi:hypothetical protein